MATVPKEEVHINWVYNTVAKRLRDNFPMDQNVPEVLARRTAIVILALDFAKGFKRRDPDFRHLEWLDKCSPDPDVWPLSELWKER